MTDPLIYTAEQILKRLGEAGIPQAVIARKLALPPSAVSNLFAGKRHLKLHEANILLELIPGVTPPTRNVPIIGMSGAGKWLEAIEDAKSTLALPGELGMVGEFAVEIVGDSMNLAGLAEGSFALIDPQDKRLFNGKIYLLRNADGEATIKRYRSEPARFEPVSDNPEYEAFEVGSSDFQPVGRVTGAISKF